MIVRAPLKAWTFADGTSHFMSIEEKDSGEIRAHALLVRRGFGSVKVEVQIAGFCWKTSLFPSKGGGYFLPVKLEAMRETGIVPGEEVEARLELL